MPEPIYEGKVKEDTTSQPDPVIETQPQISQEDIDHRADAIAAARVEALKQELATSLSGQKQKSRYGKNGPESWDKLHEEIKADAVREAEERIAKRMEEQRKQEEAQKTETAKQQAERLKQEAATLTQEWAEAVQDGIIPDIAPEIKEKLKMGTTYQDLTEDERNDEGIRAYNEARIMHAKLKSEGKSNSFYRTIQKFYGGRQDGTSAPVFGGGPPTGSSSELSYEDVVKNRKAKLGF